MLSETKSRLSADKAGYAGKSIRLFLFIFALLMASCSNEKQTTPTEPVTEDQLAILLKDAPDDVRSEILRETPEEVRTELSKEFTQNMSKELNSGQFFIALIRGIAPLPNLAGRCAPFLLTLDPITGSGIGTIIHRFTTVQSHCLNPLSLEFTEGEAVFTAVSSGDQLWETYFGNLIPTINPNILIINGRTTFTGGTGMFEGATGNGFVIGVLSFSTGKLTLINFSTLNSN